MGWVLRRSIPWGVPALYYQDAEFPTTATEWGGNFAPNAPVLSTNGQPGPLKIVFDAPVFGVGMQIQASYTYVFTGTITAYDSAVGGNVVGTSTVNGLSNDFRNDSAVS